MSELTQIVLAVGASVALAIHSLSFLITRRIAARREAACEHNFEQSKTFYHEDGETSALPILVCTRCGSIVKVAG